MKHGHSVKKNNHGYTLVELIVVIAIMSILVGGSSIGLSLLFSKDASSCATRLNDAIYTTRMNSMSKTGNYTLKVDNTGTANIATIACSDVTPAIPDTVIPLDDTQNTKRTTIKAYFATESNLAANLDGQEIILPINIKFDKAKGSVKFDIDGDGTDDDGIIIFKIHAERGNRDAKVQLVTTTGKHTIGEFK